MHFMQELLQSIANDVKDIFAYGIETTKANAVPSRHDDGLTFPIGADKKGKIIETCVLFIDIRNSTKISRMLRRDVTRLGKIYEAFIYTMTWVADEYGFVRNIVGDRVMVVFEPTDCFKNAVECAAAMYTVAMKILKPYIGIDDFKVGIGIEYGELLILKGGIQKRDKEQSEYKGLVWVGDAANIASKLTDCASKEFPSDYEVTYSTVEIENTPNPKFKTYMKYISPYPASVPIEPQFIRNYVRKNRTVTLSASEFIKEVKFTPEGQKYKDSNVLSIVQKGNGGNSYPILLSGKVCTEYLKAVPDSPYAKRFEKKEYSHCPYVATGIYGAALIHPESNQLKLK